MYWDGKREREKVVRKKGTHSVKSATTTTINHYTDIGTFFGLYIAVIIMTTSLQNPQFAIACRIAVKRAGNVGHVLACMMHAYPHSTHKRPKIQARIPFLVKRKKKHKRDWML